MKNYQRTIIACFAGYIVQAIINNFAPLLFFDISNTVSDSAKSNHAFGYI